MGGNEKGLYKNVTSRINYFVETTGTFPESLISNRYWIGLVDYYNRHSFIFFTKTKSQLPKNVEEFFKKMASLGALVKYLRCNHSGEYQSKLQGTCEKEKFAL